MVPTMAFTQTYVCQSVDFPTVVIDKESQRVILPDSYYVEQQVISFTEKDQLIDVKFRGYEDFEGFQLTSRLSIDRSRPELVGKYYLYPEVEGVEEFLYVETRCYAISY